MICSNKSAVVLLLSCLLFLCLGATVFSQNAISPRLDSMEARILRDGMRSNADTTSGNQITGQLLRDCINQAQIDVVTIWPEATQRKWGGHLDGDCGCLGMDSTFFTENDVILVYDTELEKAWRPLKPGKFSFLRDSTESVNIPPSQIRNIEWYKIVDDTVYVHPLPQGTASTDSLLVFGSAHPLPLSAGANTTIIRDEYRSIWFHRSAQYVWEAVHEWTAAATHQRHWDEAVGKRTTTTVTQESTQ